MTDHIEVVREALRHEHSSGDGVAGAPYCFTEHCYVAECSEAGNLAALDSLEAELARRYDEGMGLRLRIGELEAELARARNESANRLRAELARVREERDIALHTVRMLQNPEYRAALTGETEPDNYVGSAGAEHVTGETEPKRACPKCGSTTCFHPERHTGETEPHPVYITSEPPPTEAPPVEVTGETEPPKRRWGHEGEVLPP
jgi:hypothetical protein